MNGERFNPENDTRQATVSIPDAYRIVWAAGNIALGHGSQSEAVNKLLADEVGRIFAKLDTLQEESEIFAQALPDAQTPKITIGTLLAELDQEKRDIYNQQALISDQPVNPFLIHDDRLQVIEILSLNIEAAYNSI